MRIKLQTVIDAIEQVSDAYMMLYDTKTGETVYLPDVWITGETDEELAKLVENEPERFLQFPTKYEIHEYSIMESFVDYLPPGRIKSELSSTIRGKGAFRVSSSLSVFMESSSCGMTTKPMPIENLPNAGAETLKSNLNEIR